VVDQGATPVALNRIDRPGTAEESWDAWAGLTYLPVADPLDWPSAVIVAAHPDDEILGVGGTMSMLAAAGIRLRLIAVTDGEASHPGLDREAIARVRTMESAAARDVLGVHDIEVFRLRLPDTGLTACEDELAARLRELCAGFAVCLAPWEADAHADHEAAGRAARRTGQHVLSYPIWMWHWAKPGDPAAPSGCSPGCSPGAATRCCRAMWQPPRSALPPGAPQTCPRSGSSSASCPEAGRPAAST
jgi:hypothetical protein